MRPVLLYTSWAEPQGREDNPLIVTGAYSAPSNPQLYRLAALGGDTICTQPRVSPSLATPLIFLWLIPEKSSENRILLHFESVMNTQ